MPIPFIQSRLNKHPRIYDTPFKVLGDLFATLGTGIDSKLFNNLPHGYYMDFDPSTPVTPITFIYPFDINEKFQPYQSFVGLDGVYGNFKEAMDYFLKCIEITDPHEYVMGWKPKDLQCCGGYDAVRAEIIQWKDYIPVIRQMYGII